MSKRTLFALGGITILIGLIGKIIGNEYLKENPIKGGIGKVISQFGADIPWQTKFALFFSEYGLIVAGIGIGLVIIGFALKR